MQVPCLSILLTCFIASTATAETIPIKVTADRVLYGEAPGALAGYALASGDFDGDGMDDVAVGAPWSLAGSEQPRDPGVVYLLFGRPDFATGWSNGLADATTRIVGVRRSHGIGQNLAAGDFDGDGFDDILVGSPWTAEGDTTLNGGGAAYLVLGRPRGEFPATIPLPDAANIVFASPGREYHLGEAVHMLDFDADSLADVALGAMYANGPKSTRPHAGATYLYAGRKRKEIRPRVDLNRDANLEICGADRDDTLGRALASTDWNGDGYEDLVIGMYYGDGPDNSRRDPGEAHVVLGRPRKAMKKKLIDLRVEGASHAIFGAEPLGAFGRAVAAGDLDGDGFGDVVVSAYRAPESGKRALSGTVDIVYGGAEPPASFDVAESVDGRVLGAYYWDHCGRTLAVDDLNGDGRAELLVGIPMSDPENPDLSLRNQAGTLGILRGRPKSEAPDTLDLATSPFDHAFVGADADDQMPWCVVVADLDGDGKRDLIVGTPVAHGRGNDWPWAGEIYFLLGASRSW